MLGKASEIKTAEMWHNYLYSWLDENPNVVILDIKYALSSGDRPSVLIIYKEGFNADKVAQKILDEYLNKEGETYGN